MTELNLNDVADDVEKSELIPAKDKIMSLANLARQQIQIEQTIEEMELALSKKKEELKAVSEFKIPELFSALGIDQFKLNNGLKVKVSPYYSGKAETNEAFDWLEDHGHDDIIKGEYTIMYRRNDKAKLSTFQTLANQMGFTVKDKLAVHHMTMSSFVKEQLEAGVNLPRDLFNVFTGFKTKIGK